MNMSVTAEQCIATADIHMIIMPSDRDSCSILRSRAGNAPCPLFQKKINNQIWLIQMCLSLITPPSLSFSLPPSVSLPSFSSPFAMLAGPNLPADSSIPWHDANWHHCRRGRENERKLVNNRGRRSEREKERGMGVYGGEKMEGERGNNNGGLKRMEKEGGRKRVRESMIDIVVISLGGTV